jgi:hypothetical protein
MIASVKAQEAGADLNSGQSRKFHLPLYRCLGQDRLNKERAMRRRQLKALWKRLGQLQQMKLNARNLLLKLGEAKGPTRLLATSAPAGRPLPAADKPLRASAR